MAWNYFPVGYQYPQSFPQSFPQNPQPTPQSNNGLVWVQGEAGAKSYLTAPNSTVLLMDSESDSFYLKSTDASGMPLPLRVFDYKERKSAYSEAQVSKDIDISEYVTKSEFEAFRGQIEALLSAPIGKHNKDGEIDG